MSAAANPIDVFPGELTVADFKRCGFCGSPLPAPHLRNAANPEFQFGDQIWQCVECGSARKWGENRPPNERLYPALGCGHCDAVTRHRFVCVA